jgi:hypothetical protein
MRRPAPNDQHRYTVHAFPWRRFCMPRPLFVAAVWRRGLVVDAFETERAEDADALVVAKYRDAIRMAEHWRPWNAAT